MKEILSSISTWKKLVLVTLTIHEGQFKPATSTRFHLNFKLCVPVIFLSFTTSAYYLFEL